MTEIRTELTVSTALLLLLPCLLSFVSGTGDGHKFIDFCPTETEAGYCSRPFFFPKSIELTQTNFEGFDGRTNGKNLWSAYPRTEHDIVKIANWAAKHHYKVRPHGVSHSSSPAVITNGTNCQEDQVILLEATKYMTGMKIISKGSSGPASVVIEAGTTIEPLLDYLEDNGFDLEVCPDYGGLSFMGVLGTGAHGNPIRSEKSGTEGPISVTPSNLVLSFRAVVWSSVKHKYILKHFDRSDPEAKALLTCLGRTILTSATIRIVPKFNLRMQSILNIPSNELLGFPTQDKTKQTLASFIIPNGAVEALWYPNIGKTWLKITTLEPIRPLSSKLITEPYAFSNIQPSNKSTELTNELFKGNWYLYPELEGSQFEDIKRYVQANHLLDIWGRSKDVSLGSQGTEAIIYVSAQVIITAISNVQNIIAEFSQFYLRLLEKYTDRSIFPAYQLDFKVNRLDQWQFLSEPPSLSTAKPILEHPKLDTSIYIQFVSPGEVPIIYEFSAEIEYFLMTNIHNNGAFVRPEWAKNFAHTELGPFTSKHFMRTVLPSLYPGNSNSGGWDWTISVLDKYDPSHTFTNKFTENLLAKTE